jgi:hypothetical protein
MAAWVVAADMALHSSMVDLAETAVSRAVAVAAEVDQFLERPELAETAETESAGSRVIDEIGHPCPAYHLRRSRDRGVGIVEGRNRRRSNLEDSYRREGLSRGYEHMD